MQMASYFQIIQSNLKLLLIEIMQSRTSYPLSKPLPIPEAWIAKGPYYVDANRIIIKKFLLSSNHSPSKATLYLHIWEHFRRMAVQRKMLPPPGVEAVRGINVKSWANETLDMLREFIAYTPPAERCLCKTMELNAIEDHWIECPVGCEMKRARSAKEKAAPMEERVRKIIDHSQEEVLRELSDFQFKGLEDRVKLESSRRTSHVCE